MSLLKQPNGLFLLANMTTANTCDRNETKCREKICSLENELKSTEQHIQDLKAEMSTIETEARDILEEQENLQVIVLTVHINYNSFS